MTEKTVNTNTAPAQAGAYLVHQARRRARYALVFFVLIAAFCLITVLNINIGNIPIPLKRIVEILFTKTGNPTEVNIIWKIRLPRILMAAILGGALSLAGFLLQTFFENPIAGPFVLGISSGAKMVVAFAMIYFIQIFGVVSSYTLILAAFVGSLLSVGFILLFSRRIPSMSTLLVAGIMIGYICTDAYFVWFTLRHSSNLSIDPRTVIDRARRRLAVTAREVGSILAIGIPSAITNLTQSVGIVMINLFLLPYGTDAVAAMGIALKVIMIAVLVFVGFAFGAQPLIGYNYGARNMPRLRGILRFSYLFLSLFALVMTVVLSLSDRLLMGFFIEDATIITLGAGMLRVQLLSLVCVAVVMVTTCTFQSAGKAVGAFVLSISRQGVMLAITLFVGSRLAGYQGVIAAQAIADLLTAIVAVILFVVMLPELRSRKAR